AGSPRRNRPPRREPARARSAQPPPRLLMCVAAAHGRPPSSNQVCAPGCRRASGRAEARTRSAWAKVKRELIEDVTRCNRPAFRQERYETAAEMPDSTWIVVERPLIGQRLAASGVGVEAEHGRDRVGVEPAPVQEPGGPAQLGRIARIGGATRAQGLPRPLGLVARG